MTLRLALILSWLFLAARPSLAAELNALPTNAPARIELSDQFSREQKLTFPSARVVLLTLADRKGSEQIAGWVAPVHERFGKQIQISGVADVSSVPTAFRGTVRKKFQKVQSYPVLMDWSGDTVKRFGYQAGHAEVLVIDRRGRILKRFRGSADKEQVAVLCSLLEKTVSKSDPS